MGRLSRWTSRQVGIWTILALCSVFGVLLGIVVVGWKPKQPRKHERILRHVADCKPHVEWDGREPVRIHFRDPIANLNLDDGDLALLAEISTLRAISIHFAPNVTDTGVAHLSQLSELGGLWLSFTPVGDKGLASLADLGDLRSLTLYATDVTDVGVVHLAKMPRLGTLDLSRSRITNDGLMVFAESPSLQFLTVTVDEDNITKGAVQRLHKEAPHIEVFHDYGPDMPSSPSAPSRFLGGSIPSDDRILLLLVETAEGQTITQLVCSVRRDQLASIQLKPRELEAQGPSLFKAMQSRLPPNLVDWFLEGSPSAKTATPISDRDIDALIGEGLRIRFVVGCRQGDSITAVRIVK